jgi:hypothetical protein
MKKLELKIQIGGRKLLFIEDIPAEYCSKSAPRDATSNFITKILESRERDVLKLGRFTCLYCEKPATRLFGTPCISLWGDDGPPTVISISQQLCRLDWSSPCTREAYTRMEQGIRDANGPIAGDSSVHRMQAK